MLFQFRMWLQSIRSLLLHPLRALLTVLGIFIGVAGVIWLLAIGEGISRAAQRQIEELGATTIILRSVMPIEETSSGATTSGAPAPSTTTSKTRQRDGSRRRRSGGMRSRAARGAPRPRRARLRRAV